MDEKKMRAELDELKQKISNLQILDNEKSFRPKKFCGLASENFDRFKKRFEEYMTRQNIVDKDLVKEIPALSRQSGVEPF